MLKISHFPSCSFDCVHSHHVWEHLLNPLAASIEVYRILKNNGIYYYELPNQFDNIMFRRDMLLNRVPQRSRNMYCIHHNYFFSKKTLRRLLEKAGFKSLTIRSKYEWPMRGWRTPFSLLTRILGAMAYGGSIIYGYAVKKTCQKV